MTTIIIQKDKNNAYRGFICMGHAQYAKRHLFRQEPDVLCSAISVLVIGTINSLAELAGEKLTVTSNEETGFIKCGFDEPLLEKSAFLLDSMVFTLESLSEKYGGKYLQVKFEEV